MRGGDEASSARPRRSPPRGRASPRESNGDGRSARVLSEAPARPKARRRLGLKRSSGGKAGKARQVAGPGKAEQPRAVSRSRLAAATSAPDAMACDLAQRPALVAFVSPSGRACPPATGSHQGHLMYRTAPPGATGLYHPVIRARWLRHRPGGQALGRGDPRRGREGPGRPRAPRAPRSRGRRSEHRRRRRDPDADPRRVPARRGVGHRAAPARSLRRRGLLPAGRSRAAAQRRAADRGDDRRRGPAGAVVA